MTQNKQPDHFTTNEKGAISLNRFHVTDLKFHVDNSVWNSESITQKSDFKFSFNAFLDETKNDYFGLDFKTILENDEKTYKLEIQFVAHFLTINMPIDEAFLSGHYVSGNAPAIVFPYLRAYITNFFQNSGYHPIILPAFNFNSVEKVEKIGS